MRLFGAHSQDDNMSEILLSLGYEEPERRWD
ncbi:hypothetical protein MMMDOFMJ_3492 [Methylobacterium gnaphalii]|nr:hypothetical protein MMMDOFMJ_3492 [Methylobacterium gnaphalii]